MTSGASCCPRGKIFIICRYIRVCWRAWRARIRKKRWSCKPVVRTQEPTSGGGRLSRWLLRGLSRASGRWAGRPGRILLMDVYLPHLSLLKLMLDTGFQARWDPLQRFRTPEVTARNRAAPAGIGGLCASKGRMSSFVPSFRRWRTIFRGPISKPSPNIEARLSKPCGAISARRSSPQQVFSCMIIRASSPPNSGIAGGRWSGFNMAGSMEARDITRTKWWRDA